jgi:hypothetical protein
MDSDEDSWEEMYMTDPNLDCSGPGNTFLILDAWHYSADSAVQYGVLCLSLYWCTC